ncbi:hypothetical protein N8I74_17150 [Chitiniphilus purpureus]|uniref:Uncharacterized protein n=1 Tax=Chitiniphilus purpureus TaxID=2981137 RepID=A0ABY6DKX8_9NEIS|nr:hypothetical protein [Chitiniphilus sp. CD1]UXY15019.1 hypothetical protein N8I74_17150 [Chitiniphilus sp. CD1]
MLARLSAHLMPPFDDGERIALMRRWSDLEAGSPRQWLWLELAGSGPAHRSMRVRLLGRLLDWGGPWLIWHWLACAQLPALALYGPHQRALQRRLRQMRQDGLLWVLCLPAFLAGFDRWPESQALLAWTVTLSGALYQAWRWRAPAVPDPGGADDGEVLPGPEASLGLAGLLIAAGYAPAAAARAIAALHTDADTALPTLAKALPQLRPPPPSSGPRIVLALLHWLAATVPAACALGLLPAPWGLVAAGAWAMLLTRRAGTAAMLLTAVAPLLVYGSARLAHWL